MRRGIAAPLARRLLARLLVVLAIVPVLLAMPASAAPPIATFNYTTAANAPIGIDPSAIATADLNGDSKQDIAVTNCFNNTVSVLLGNGNGTFTPAPGSPIAVETCPDGVVLTDLNNDSKQDLIVSNNGSNTVSVLLGNGNGTFTPAPGSPFPAGSTPNALAVGDVTGDTKKDIVVTNRNANTVSVLAGNGSGGFSAPTATATGTQPYGVALGDVDGVNGLDILVVNSGSNNVSVLLNNGSGAFSPATGSPITVGANPGLIALGKLHTGGFLDFVVTNTGSSSVSVFLGNGACAFSPASGSPISFPGTSPVAVALDLFNADSNLDLVVSDHGSSGTYVLAGNGNGTFATPPAQPTLFGGNLPIAVAVADVDGDSKKDLLTVNEGDNTISVFKSKGDGTFTTLSPFAPFIGGSAAVLGDFNGDGKQDIATTGGGGQVYVGINSGAGVFGTHGPFAVGGTGVSAIATEDVNGGGKKDLVVAVAGSPTMVTVLLGDGSGNFTSAAGSPFAAGTCSLALNVGLVIGDLNGDGKQDIAVTNCTDDSVSLFFGAGAGTFTAGAALTGFDNPSTIAISDLRSMSRKDLIVSSSLGVQARVLLNNGSGAFTDAPGSPILELWSSIAVADLNHDGKPDLIVPNTTPSTQFVDVMLGNGNGAFMPAISSPNIASFPLSIVVGDLNNDGIPDLAVVGQSLAGRGGNLVDALLGKGDGTFAIDPGSPFPTGWFPVTALIGDLNGDGKRDIVTSGFGAGVLLNNSAIPNPLPNPKPPGVNQPGPPNPLPIPPQPSGPNGGVPNPLPPRRP